MEVFGYGVRAHKARFAIGAIAGALFATAAITASAQSNTGTATDNAPSDAARRAAQSPYRFIIQSASAPTRKAAPAKPAETAAAVPEPKRSAPPVQQAMAQPRAPAAAPAPAAAEAAAPAPAPAQSADSAVAALSRKPLEPPPKRDVIPIRTDEPRLSPALLREQPHGVVKVQFDIQPDGSVGDVKIASSTNRVLNKPTVEAVQGWKFQPVDEVLTVETEIDYKLDQ